MILLKISKGAPRYEIAILPSLVDGLELSHGVKPLLARVRQLDTLSQTKGLNIGYMFLIYFLH